jgi:hypothetical protein
MVTKSRPWFDEVQALLITLVIVSCAYSFNIDSPAAPLLLVLFLLILAVILVVLLPSLRRKLR